MKIFRLAAAAILFGPGSMMIAPPAHGTDTYEYKPGETRVIDHGLSPDKRFAVAAGVNAKGDFRLYLVDAGTRRRIGPLEEATDALDTGAESLHAAWAPDSRHVALTYRVSHQENVLWLYRVENRRAFVVTGPKDLFPEVNRTNFGGVPLDAAHLFLGLTWVSATRFTLHEESSYNHLPGPPPAALKVFTSDVEASEVTDDDGGGKSHKEYMFGFAADGDCELTGDDKFRVAAVKPAAPR